MKKNGLFYLGGEEKRGGGSSIVPRVKGLRKSPSLLRERKGNHAPREKEECDKKFHLGRRKGPSFLLCKRGRKKSLPKRKRKFNPMGGECP